MAAMVYVIWADVFDVILREEKKNKGNKSKRVSSKLKTDRRGWYRRRGVVS
jgi:hypothetical protein